MKRILLFVGLAVAALSFVGCNKQESEPAVKDSQVSIRLVTPETKTVSSDWSTFWAEGDALSVFYTPAGRRDYSDNIKFEVTSPDDGIAKADVTLDDGTYDWYAFYPYNEYFPSPANNNSDPARTYIGGRSDRAQVQEGYSNLDHVAGPNVPLYGIVTGVSSTTDPEILMKHVASLAEILVTNNSGEPVTITGIELSAPEDVDIVGYYNITFDDEPTFTKYMDYQSNTAKLTVTDGQPLRNSAYAKFYLVVKPFEADELTVKVITDAGSQEKTATIPSTAVFTSGHIKTLNFSFDGPDAGSSTIAEMLALDNGESVVSNEVLVVAKASTGVLIQEGDDYILVYGRDAVADVEVGDMVVVQGTIGSYSGTKQITSPTVTVKSSGNPVSHPTATDITDDFEDYSASFAEYVSFTGVLTVSGSYYNVKVGDITAKIGSILVPAADDVDAIKELNGKRVQVTGYYLYMTSSNKYFNVIATDVEAVGGAVETTISVTTINVSLYEGDTKALGAKSNNPDATFYYVSDDTSIATVDSEGNVFGVSAGETTITVSTPEVPNEFTAAELVVNVTVNPKSSSADGDWVATDLADIVSGDQFVLVATKDGASFAMSNDGKGNKKQPLAIAVTVSGTKLESAPENTVWTMEKSGSSFIFHPGSDMDSCLYVTNDNNGLRTGTGDHNVITWDSTINYLEMNDGTYARNLGVYYSSGVATDWRCYKVAESGVASNIKDQTFTFYVKQ